MNPVVLLIVFAVIAVAELPDKSMFASLALATRYRPSWVFTGIATAFTVHVVIAVIAGGLLTLLPHRVVEAIVAVLFAAGAVWLFRSGLEEITEGLEEAETVAREVRTPTFPRVALTSFAVVFVGEWGDITQVLTANYAARYDDPLSVAVGAIVGLWLTAALAVTVGQQLIQRVPVTVVRRVGAVILLGFAVASAVSAARG